MISCYIREQKRYSAKDLERLWEMPESRLTGVLKQLCACNVVKPVRVSDAQRDLTELRDEDVVFDTASGEELYYVFTFVGVIIVSGRILRCYPKYLPDGAQPVNELKQVIKVLEKCRVREQDVSMVTEPDACRVYNPLALILALLSDYHEYGLYSNTQELTESNGTGEIIWDRTINDTFALIQQGRPYYTELKTHRRVQDEYDYFRRLHACVLTDASRKIEMTGLAEMFDIAMVDLSDEHVDDFGDREYVLSRIEKELNVEFNTRKQRVLKAMFAYISNDIGFMDEDCFAVYGTNSFNVVWEKVCKDVLDDQLQRTLGSLKLPQPLAPGYNRGSKLIDIIEKPLWEGDTHSHFAQDTLIPDAVSIEGQRLIIYDAKYYVARIEAGRTLSGQPGIDSITKQYLYQLAYEPFTQAHGITGIVNCFLLPTQEDHVLNKGTVSLNMMDRRGIRRIQVRFLPAAWMFEAYLSGTHHTSVELGL